MAAPANARAILIAASSAALWAPSIASAAAGSAKSGSSAGAALVAVLIIAAAYVLAYRVVGWLEQRFLVRTGLEYILLGVALGSDAFGIRLFQNITPLLPIIALAAGWVGLMRGTQLSYRELRDAPRGLASVITLQHLLAGGAVGAAAYFAFRSPYVGIRWQEAAVCAAALACFAASDSSEPLALLSKRYNLVGRLSPILRAGDSLGDLFVIVAFGLIFCATQGSGDRAQLSWFEWLGVTFAVGAVLGVLFRWFLAEDETGQTSFVALAGIISFASGAAFFLELSPLLVNLVMGLFLKSSPSQSENIEETLERTERPMSIVLLVLAGVLLEMPPIIPTIVGFVAFVLLRAAGKALGNLLGAYGREVRRDIFRAGATQGDVAVAMAVSFRLVYEGVGVDIAYAIVLLSVVFHGLIGPRFLRGLLVDAGEITRETPRESSSEPSMDPTPEPSGAH